MEDTLMGTVYGLAICAWLLWGIRIFYMLHKDEPPRDLDVW